MLAGALGTNAAAQPAPLLPLSIDGDGIDAPLTGQPGDPARGRAIVADRQLGTCLLCHTAPIAEEKFQGNIGPDLRGAADRLTRAQLRLRVADASRLNPDTVMPSYYVVSERNRVGRNWAGRPVLDAGQIEDVVAWLATLHTP